MKEEFVSKRIWLFLLREGGCWTGSAIRSELRLDREQAYQALNGLAKRGMVEREVPTEYGKVIKYAVTPNCRVPDCMTLAEVTA